MSTSPLQTTPARGMRDFLPADVRRRQFVIRTIAQVYERYGFEPLETPAVENLETLQGKYGEEGNQLIFKILKRGEHEASGQADLALRYDLTVPLARVIAHERSLPRLFRRYQIQPVWRADRPAKGRFREFYQCDVDAIGSTSPVVEVELCAAAAETLARLGFEEFTIRLNHRQLLTGLLTAARVPGDLHGQALTALDKLDKIGREAVGKELRDRGVSAEAAQAALDIFVPVTPQTVGDVEAVFKADPERVLKKLAMVKDLPAEGLAALANLNEIVELATSTPAAGKLRIDPSLARGLSYYTGAIMEMAVPDLAGSLGGGGRYDNLVGMFLGQPIPACGFSLGLERILVVMGERGMFPPTLDTVAAEAMLVQWNAGTMADTLALAGELRSAGLRVFVYPDADKLGKQFKYASSIGVPFAVVQGDDERAVGEVTVKDLRAGTQQRMARGDAAAWIRTALGM